MQLRPRVTEDGETAFILCVHCMNDVNALSACWHTRPTLLSASWVSDNSVFVKKNANGGQ